MVRINYINLIVRNNFNLTFCLSWSTLYTVTYFNPNSVPQEVILNSAAANFRKGGVSFSKKMKEFNIQNLDNEI